MKRVTLFLFVLGLFLQFPIIHVFGDNQQAERKISSYSQLIIQEYQKSTQKMPSKTLQKNTTLFINKGGTNYVKSFIRFEDDSALAALTQKGVILGTILDGVVSGLLPLDQINEISNIDAVTAIEFAQPVYARLDSVRKNSNITPIHQGLAPLSKPYQGNGVIVGVVDEGFDFTHPNYYDTSGSNYRVSKVWSQTASGAGSAPSGYTSGIEYTTPSAIQAIQTDNTQETHGTHTSGIAAGGGYTTPFTGIAPASEIILVATDMTTTGIVDGVQYIVTQAENAQKPCAVNLSLGSQVGPHDGTSASDVSLDQLSGAGHIIVGAAGNNGESNIHILKEFTTGGTQTLSTVFVPSDAATTTEMLADIWGRNNTAYSVQVLIYDTNQNGYTAQTTAYPVSNQSNQFTLTGNTASYTVAFYNQLYSGNNCYNSLVYIQPQTTFNTTEQLVIRVTHNKADTVNLWATNGTFASNNYNGFTSGDTNYTVGEIGGVGHQIISVGAYATKLKWLSYGNQKYYSYEGNPTLYAIAPFSSKGPTADNRIKPDISAPGFGVVSGFNSYNPSYGASNNQVVTMRTFNSRNYYWGIDQGTSMACPVVTGTIALWLEANPTLTPDQIRSIFKEHAFPSTLLRAPTQDNVFGWGKLDALSGLQEAIALSTIPVQEQQNATISISPNPSKGHFRIIGATPFGKIQLTDLSGRTIFEQQFETPLLEYEMQINNMIPGIYMISLQSESGTNTSKVVIQ